jgi:multidrug efflux system membrane fusion protein
MKTLRWICWTAALVSAVVLSGCKEKVKPGTAQVKRATISGVQVGVLKPTLVDELYETAATVKAKSLSAVASKVMGAVTAVKVKEGDVVTAGQELVTIDDRDLQHKLRAAEAGLKEAGKALEAGQHQTALAEVTSRRYRQLFAGKAISRQEMDQVETQAKVSAAELERIQAMVARAQAGVAETQVVLGYTRLVAPVSGVITEKKIEVGNMAVPGMPLLLVEDNSAYKLDISVDEGLSGKLAVGMPVEISIESIGQEAEGSIVEIVPAVDPASRTFLVKTQVQAPGLRSGLYARVRVPLGKKEVLLAPAQAVVERGELTGVYRVAADGVVTYGLIRTGKRYGDQFEVLSGLRAGDRMLVSGVDRAIDGGVVEEGK